MSWKRWAVLVLVAMAGCREAAREEPALVWEKKKFERALEGCGDVAKRVEPCVTFRVEWPEVVGGMSKEAMEKTNGAIRASLQAADAPPGLEAEAAQVMADYEEFQAQFPRSSVNYFTRRLAEVGLERGRLVSVEVRAEEYRGGAEVESRRSWVNVDRRTGERVELGAMLRGGGLERLRTKLGGREDGWERAWGASRRGLEFGAVTVGWGEVEGLLKSDWGLAVNSR